MAAIVRTHRLDPVAGPVWPHVAAAARGWLAAQGLAPRDAVVLLPYAALLAPARAAFATGGGWQPRIETPLTLAAALAPPPQPSPGAWCGDAVLDRINAAALLRLQPWGRARERDDRRSFDHIAAAVVDAATALARAAHAQPPDEREAWWSRARDALPPATSIAGFEALLLRAALEWAAQGGAAVTDVLFDHRPAARIAVRIGGSDAVAEALLGHRGVPGLLIDADVPAAAEAVPGRIVCDGFEHEAQAAAAQVIEALNAGRVPVALVALDRVLVRRVRALLDRQQVPILDETGWKLSTTRAAARLMALLQAAAPAAGADARLEWLKTWPAARERPHTLAALERAWRAARPLGEGGAALWQRAEAFLQPFADGADRSLDAWLALLRDAIGSTGGDPAAEQVWRALRVDDGSDGATPAWRDAATALRLDLAAFTAWVDATLESAQFVPPPRVEADVVLTPLARAIGRPFGQVVVPGADALHLGAVDPAPLLVGEALADTLGLDGARSRRERQRLVLAQLLRVPALTLLRRRLDGDEPLAASPEVESLALARARSGAPLPPERDWQPLRAPVAPAPLSRPAPRAGAELPPQMSATTVEALRQCPYRFFARAVLRLSDPDELDAEPAKRDYGTWLHAVLHRFHSQRDGVDDAAALAAAADAVGAAQPFTAADMLPFRASFETFAPAYLAWLRTRDAQGYAWDAGEIDRTLEPPSWQPQTLRGRLDRLDRMPDGTLQLIDYKTGSAQKLKDRVFDRLEDTQLPFYAALKPGVRSAIYLALDDARSPLAVTHHGVDATAALLVEQVGAELQRVRDGAGLPALGEEPVCGWCEARGLCRRDHWTAEP